MLISEINPGELTPEQMVHVLYPGDPKEAKMYGDVIMVFGNGNLDRVTKAIELFKEGRASEILFSGGDQWGEREEAEAISMKRFALEKGVPEDAISIETFSNNTKENVLASLLVIDRKLGLHNIKRIIAVSDAGHLRRCLQTLRTYMPGWIDFIMVGTGKTLPPNWWTIKPIKDRAVKEIKSLVQYTKEGQLADSEIIF
ncbi:YdcF family protein [Paenibacillus lemnae]|uniref:YdcF family protein n=1 Tax=Paenibacillus lemnae TaxID=1330551 RepID=A0A848MCG1_PAELE|nr:YdcF family protein [Paenibacillus lemnae]NMO98186.1 YdcF family protein [Paenibacillus lemnae]